MSLSSYVLLPEPPDYYCRCGGGRPPDELPPTPDALPANQPGKFLLELTNIRPRASTRATMFRARTRLVVVRVNRTPPPAGKRPFGVIRPDCLRNSNSICSIRRSEAYWTCKVSSSCISFGSTLPTLQQRAMDIVCARRALLRQK